MFAAPPLGVMPVQKGLIFMYNGRSINMLQNDVIQSIFKIRKIWNFTFVGNLISDMYWNFHEDDFINVPSVVGLLRTQSVGAIFSQQWCFLSQNSLVKHIDNKKKTAEVQQTNVTLLNALMTGIFLGQWRKSRVGRNSHLMRRCNQPFVSFMDSSRHFFLDWAQ